MKFTVVAVLALAAVTYGRSVDFEDTVEVTTAFNFHERFGIPQANKIREAEEAESNGERIVGGSPAAVGQFPYTAGLVVHTPGGQGACSGSLLNQRRVVTAAHCWWDGRVQANRFTVVLGSNRLFSGGVRLDSWDVVMHGSWNPTIVRNDVAIIRLPSNVGLSNTVNVITLPSGSQLNENFSGQRAVASGYGITRDGTGVTINQSLNHVTLDVITNAECQRTPGIGVFVTATNICTSGAGGRSTCGGDSGGPLAITRNNRPLMIGITSFGHAAGCQAGFPAVFARTSSFVDFINRNL